MPQLRIHNVTVSLDGFGAGPHQDLEHPLGLGGKRLHEWVFATRSGQAMIGSGEGGETGIDDDFILAGEDGIGATIMGRNMFGPIRGDWGDGSWSGWWGDEPPYHHPAFVLTHHPRDPIEMTGGTTFHFVTGGIQEAYDRAMEAAGGADVRLGGGVATVRAYLEAGLVDRMHLAIVPVLLGRGERVLDGFDEAAIGLRCTELVSSGAVTHACFERPA